MEYLEKLELQPQMSVNSLIAGSDGEMDCIISNWDDKLKNIFELTEPVYTVILRRKMADGFI